MTESRVTQRVAKRVDGGVDVAETVRNGEQGLREGVRKERLPADNYCNSELL